MFPSFIGIIDIQSWWEVPSIAHFCSLFRAAFNLLDFDIEELEEALLTDGTEETASSLLTDLIVRLLRGCLGNNDISAFNYQMFLRRLFRQKCQETGRYNPFNTDIDFQFLPLRTKVEILYALCDFRLDANDVFYLFKNLEAESLRVEPLGYDDNSSTYWYFYGTRLYREDYKIKPKSKTRKKDEKKSKGDDFEDDTERVWQVVCFTESDWNNLTDKFKNSTSKVEKDLYQSLSENFLPEIPRLFQEKERLRRKRLLELAPRRTSSRVQIKLKQKEEEELKLMQDIVQVEAPKKVEIETEQQKAKSDTLLARESRLRRREQLRAQSESEVSDSSDSDTESSQIMWSKRKKRQLKSRESSVSTPAATTAPPKPTGRQTNNSLACATGQIVIPDIRESVHPTRKKVKSSQIYELLDQDVVVDMYKVLEQLKSHDDAWPFMDPVEEDYAPNYYAVIRRPMDLKRMEDRLDQGYYTNFSMFKNDFKLIVNNCRLYNGQESEYTKMVNNLENAFNKLTQRYFEGESSSDDEIAIEYPIQNPYPRKQYLNKMSHKNNTKNGSDENKKNEIDVKRTEKRKIMDSYDEQENYENSKKVKKLKSSRNSDEKQEKKERGRGKSGHLRKKKKLKRLQEARKSRKDKRKKTKEKRKHKHNSNQKKEKRERRASSGRNRSRSRSRSSQIDEQDRPVASKRHLSPEIDFYKDKFDKIKERKRSCVKKVDEFSLHDKHHKEKKQNLTLPEKDKHLNLKETIEKLKAKSENIKPHPLYNDLYDTEEVVKKEKKKIDFESAFAGTDIKKKTGDEYEFVDDDELSKENSSKKQVNTKNESAREALEQAMKDINKWLDDTPKLSEFGSNSNSPLQMPITDETYNISPIVKPDDETSNSQPEKEKSAMSKKDGTRKRQSNKDPAKTVTKKKEVQRTIDRLQPGKSKGNLISNIQTTTKQEENVIVPIVKTKELKNSLVAKPEEGSPKLSLGTVLPTAGFGLGKQHNFTAESNAANSVKVEVVDTGTMTGESEEHPAEEPSPPESVVAEAEVVKEKETHTAKPQEVMKQCQEKATPNLSAWFKAFGTPKSTQSSAAPKKKTDDVEQDDCKNNEDKNMSPLDNIKNEQGDDLLTADGSESPIGNLSSGIIRARRTSTGSSISERSSFSQDLDSPRHQPSHPSPLLRSPASPRTEDLQKTYPLMNVTVRVGFYQDTTSVKSSPEKSCSPREAPQSPYTNYSQHVYASSTNGGGPNNPALPYSAEGPNKSPIPAYAQSPYYENVKSGATKPNQEDYPPVYSSDNVYQQPSSPYSHHSQHSPYSHVQSPQTSNPSTSATGSVAQTNDRRPLSEKLSVFPVKKRSYDISKDTTDDEPCLQIRASPAPLTPEIPAPPSTPSSEEGYVNNTEIINSPSVITSTHSKPAKPLNIAYPYDTISARDLSNQTKDEFQSKSVLSPYSDYASDYSLKKSQVNDYSLAGLSKSHTSNARMSTFHDSQITQQSLFSDIKNMSKGFTHDYSLKEKQQIDMVNMGYSSKVLECMKSKEVNVDMVNMGYTQPEAHSHIAKFSSANEDLRNMSSYYNPPSLSYTGRMEHGIPGPKVTATNDYLESTKRYSYNGKSSSVLQYMKPPDTGAGHSSDIVPLNSPLLRADSRQSIAEHVDSYARNSSSQIYKDWIKKNQDAHNLSLYKDNQSRADGRMSVPQMATSAVSSNMGRSSDAPTYDMTNTGNSLSDENLGKNETEVIVQPGSGVHYIRAVIKISSSMKPENQPSTPEYNLRRNVSLNLPVPSTKSETLNYERNPPLTSAYKPAHTPAPHPIDQSLLNIPNLPQIMERYAKDDRMLSPYPQTSSVSSTYQDKNLPLLFPKNMNSAHSTISSSQMYQSSLPKPYGRADNLYSQSPQPSSHNWPSEPISLESDKKVKLKKKKSIPASSPSPSISSQSYASPKSSLQSTDPAMSLKPPSILPGSAFNFGAPGSLASTLYGDSSYFLDPSTNQYMAANYIAAHQRNTPEIDKSGKPAHSSTPFQFLTPQVRPGYPLVGMESSSIYQQYIQRQQEEFLRPLHSQIMGMFPPGYNPPLSGRQPFDTIPRPWL